MGSVVCSAAMLPCKDFAKPLAFGELSSPKVHAGSLIIEEAA